MVFGTINNYLLRAYGLMNFNSIGKLGGLREIIPLKRFEFLLKPS